MRTTPLFTRDLAPSIVPVLTHLDAVAAVLCFGSTALDSNDAASDFDILAICDPAVPPTAERRRWLAPQAGLSDLALDQHAPGWDDPWAPYKDTFTLAHQRYDVTYNTVAWLAHIVHAVRTEGATSLPEMPFRPYTVLGLLTTAVILYDPHQIAHELVNQTQPYPSLLQVHILDEHVPVLEDGLAELRDYAARGIGNTAFLFHLVRVCDALSSCLFALNDTYDPATKRVEAALGRLQRLPPQFVPRYTRMLEGPFTGSHRQTIVDELAALTREVLALR